MNNFLMRLAGFSYRRALVFAVVAAGVYYGTLYDDGSSLDSRMVQLQKQLDEEQKKSRESDAALKERDLVKNAVAGLNQQFEIASQQLPSEISASEILKSIDTISRSTGVSIKSKEPKGTKTEDILELMPLKVVVQGSYSEITMFLYYLSSMERITRVTNFTFSQANPVDSRTAAPGVLIFDGEIVSYRYLASSQKPVQGGNKK
jgi:Tfp pilus assembly protein PilO